jgi:hypothetical protein
MAKRFTGKKFKQDVRREAIRQAFAWWGAFDYLGETAGFDVYHERGGFLTFYVGPRRAYAAGGGFGDMREASHECTSALLENVRTAHELQAS